jgi:hypothetical protein
VKCEAKHKKVYNQIYLQIYLKKNEDILKALIFKQKSVTIYSQQRAVSTYGVTVESTWHVSVLTTVLSVVVVIVVSVVPVLLQEAAVMAIAIMIHNFFILQ